MRYPGWLYPRLKTLIARLAVRLAATPALAHVELPRGLAAAHYQAVPGLVRP
jgi:hypothetical protein